MALTLTSLNATDIATAEKTLSTFLAEEYPSMDLKPGRVLYELLIRPAAIFYVLNNANLQTIQDSQSLVKLIEDPTLANDDVLDGIASNFGVTRVSGVKASGSITIVVSKNAVVPIQANTLFKVGNLTFTNTVAYVGVPAAVGVSSDTDRLITSIGSYFGFTIPVVATDVGTDYNITKDTRVTLEPSPELLVEAYAESSFTNGLAADTNITLINKLKNGITNPSFSSRASINSLIYTNYPNTTDISIVGFGDEEMVRDRNNIFRLSTGGKADIYVRTAPLPQKIKLTLEATLVADQTWQLAIDKNTVPAFYSISNIVKAGDDSTYTSLDFTVSRNYDNTVILPQLNKPVDYLYTRYSTAVIDITDESVAKTIGATRNYDVTFIVMPNIAELQDNYASNRELIAPQGDYLIKAPAPCFISCTVTVLTKNVEKSSAAVESIKNAVANAVNNIKFGIGQLSSSVVVSAVYNTLTDDSVVSLPLDITGEILTPDGNNIWIRNSDGITIPDLPMQGVTSRTTAFYCFPESIEVNLVPLNAKVV